MKEQYVRYGKECLVGIQGSREAVEKISARIVQFLNSKLHLEVDFTSHVFTANNSVLFLGMRIGAVLPSRWPRQYSREVETRRKSRGRLQNLAELRTEIWNKELQDLSLTAWALGLKKTKKILSSWEAAEQAMYTKAQEASRDFLFKKIRRGETWQPLERLLCKEEIFLNDAATMGIPDEILKAHRHLSLLLQKFLQDESMSVERQKKIEKNLLQAEGEEERSGDFGLMMIPLQILAPMEVITGKLRRKGILQPSKAFPTVLTSMLNSSDEAIVTYFTSLAKGLLRYYRCCDNFQKVRQLVNHQVRWSALFTLASKHGCSAKKIITTHSRAPKVVDHKGKVIAQFPSSPVISRTGKRYLPDIQQDAVDDILQSTTIHLPLHRVKKGQVSRVQLRTALCLQQLLWEVWLEGLKAKTV